MKRILLAIAACATLSAAGASPAASTEVYACHFSGLAGSLTPGVQSIARDLGDANVTDTDSGTYTFSTSGSPTPSYCVVQPGLVRPISITASGSYTNVLCGTGTADGYASGAPGFSRYDIQFVLGHGYLRGYDSNGIQTTEGYVDIVPDAASGGGNCLNEDVSRFRVTGAYTAVLP